MSTKNANLYDLLQFTIEYQNHQINLNDYKSIIWSTVLSITEVEENDFRNFLQKIEAELDSIEHTIDSNQVFVATASVIKRLKRKLIKKLNE